jgi:hypothetical protein
MVNENGNVSFDSSVIEQATLIGTANPNFQLKRLNLSFSELVSKEGKRFSVSGVAIDPETKTLGVKGDFSSGISSRLLGAAIGKAIITADQVATSHVLQNTANDDSVVTRELNREAHNTSVQAAGDISGEATRDLRETRPELSLPAGTQLTIRLKALQNSGGGP